MRAARNDCSLVVELLLDLGAEADAQSDKGETALMRAAIFGHLATLKVLLHRGARLDIHSKDGDTALTLSRFQGWETQQLLSAYAKR